jgi:Mg-chelatase subunit ChlI
MNLQQKIWNTYSYIKDNVYLCRPDITIDDYPLNSALLFGIMTSLVNGKQLIYGEYGLGKTTSSENIISMLYGFPKEVVLASSLKGNPEQTEEKMIARPNLGDLNKGIETVIWSDFVLVGPKIIDELNRMPASKQNILLEGTDRGIWKYLNDFLQNDALAIYSTSNYKDSGNTEVIPPLLDRFDVAVESKHPGINNLRYRRVTSRADALYDPEIAEKMFKVMIDEKDYAVMNKKIRNLRLDYNSRLKSKINLELIDVDEQSAAKNQIMNMGVSKEGHMFYDLFTAELTSCQVYGQKRSNEECKTGCHFSNYMCNKVSNCLSVRSDSSVKNYAAALAWLFGKKEVTDEHLAAVLPYAIWHKTQFKKEYLDEFETQERKDPLQLHVAKQSVDAMMRRFVEIKPLQEDMINAMRKGDVSKAKSIVSRSDHPVIPEYLNI